MARTIDPQTRETLLDTAEQLIYAHGIHATGMDLLVKTSGISRKSLYRYFDSKDALCAEALRRRDERWMRWFSDFATRAPSPRAQLLAMFDALSEWFASADFRGCAFINTAGETGDASDPVRQIARLHKQKIQAFALPLCQALGVADPEALALQLLILIDGAITVALVVGDLNAAASARQIAEHLLPPEPANRPGATHHAR